MPKFSGPGETYGALFDVVQSRHLFDDSKTFVDATPKKPVREILEAFTRVRSADDESLRLFVAENFRLPDVDDATTPVSSIPPIRERIDELWSILSRAADRVDAESSLIPLPRPYIVPGGRFREIYYWDSYFTMLGLAEAGRLETIEDMVENFAYLIDQIGFIPNGNRSYFCTRSQPPVFSLMVELLADVRGEPGIVHKYLPQLRREYEFWMSGVDELAADGDARRRVVKVADGVLSRYWDDNDTPRAESYAEDLEHAASSGRDSKDYYRNIRAACESGWDFSSRWLAKPDDLETIRATSIVPVDLNALLCHLERVLAACYAKNDAARAAQFESRAAAREELIRELMFDADARFFVDLDLDTGKSTGAVSLAGVFPLFLNIATAAQAQQVVERLVADFLAPGGWLTTCVRSGQQWDRPNGWAPLQWVVFRGLMNYGFEDEAKLGATRWVADNIEVYERTGRLLEKYDIERIEALASGGEYDVQEGFGWTNGVLLKLMNHLGL